MPEHAALPSAPAPAAGAGGAPAALARLVRAARAVRWYLRGVVGADAYERYLEHHHRTGCELPPMSERDFWRDKVDDLARNPKQRCC